jgi:hypothetical protein
MKRTVHCICVLILVLSLLGSFRSSPVSALGTTFIVDTSTDAYDSKPGDGICSDGVDGCSLRAAIEEAFHASSSANPVTIHFSSGIAGTLTLSLEPIDWVADYVTLDGESYNMIISGAGLSYGSVFTISGSHNTLTNLTIRDSPVDAVQVGDFYSVGSGNFNTLDYLTLVHNSAGGVYIHGNDMGGNDNQITNSNIGSLSSGNICASQYANLWDGVYIDGGADRTRLGANRIVCNGHNGVFLNGYGSAITGTLFEYDLIGTDGSGSMGNGWNGIHLINATNTQIGGSIISGNNQAGISAVDSRAGIWLQDSDNNSVLNNAIGTNAMGTYSLANLGEGILVSDGSSGNSIGNAFNPNTISGNGASGVSLESGATLNKLNRNNIGLNSAGTAAIPNALAGVAVLGADANTIGSPDSTTNQYISGNGREGINIWNSNLTYVGPHTCIGCGPDATTHFGNGWQGIMLTGTSSFTDIHASSIAWNGAAGIAITGADSIGNAYQVGKIYGNGGLAVDLGNDGHSANGDHSGPPGPNNWMPYPVITTIGAHNLVGHACANCRVDIYEASGNPIANGGGGAWLASATANLSGVWSGIVPGVVLPAGVTTVACNLATGDCSEMSPLFSGTAGLNMFLPIIVK